MSLGFAGVCETACCEADEAGEGFGARLDALSGPEATEEFPQPEPAIASAIAISQVAHLIIISLLSYGNQAQTFCHNHRNGERSRT
jgi:hypothetical protein